MIASSPSNKATTDGLKAHIYSTQEIILVALMAALGLGTKQVIGPVIKSVTAVLFVPGGTIAGGFYMLWIALGRTLVPKPFSATFISFVQSLTIFVLPYGSHGIFTFLTYIAPGLAVDIFYYLIFWFNQSLATEIFALCLYTGIANVIGTYLSGLVFGMFVGLNLLIVGIILAIAFFSGTLGGIVAFQIQQAYRKYFGGHASGDLIGEIEDEDMLLEYVEETEDLNDY